MSKVDLMFLAVTLLINCLTGVTVLANESHICERIPKNTPPFGCNQTIEAPLHYGKAASPKFNIGYWVLPKIKTSGELDLDVKNNQFIVLIPGGPLGSQFQIDTLLVQELQKRFHLIMIDHRGVDDSKIINREHWTTETFNTEAVVRDLEFVRHALIGRRPWHIFGHSYGTYVALIYAELFPKQVQKLVLSNGFSDYKVFAQQLMDSVDNAYLQKINEYLRSGHEEEAVKRFNEVYNSLQVQASQGLLKVSSKSGDDERIVSERALGFQALRWLDAAQLQQTTSVLERWHAGDPATSRWAYSVFASTYSDINRIFNCGEVIPQINALNFLNVDQTKKIEAYHKLDDCAAIEGPRFKRVPLLNQIRIPTLVVSSKQDQIVPSQFQNEMARQLPNSKLLVVPEVSHAPFHTSKQVMDTVNEFLQ